ncbi:hypothetical protein cypCar_00003693 [Cyprinus carpio]|nr:hypothetical protein cypCar_00003693 [Cyprinus carpio]
MSGKNMEEKVEQATNSKNISLPVSRVRLIMKSSPDVSCINQDALFLTTKATETNTLSYSDLANVAEETETFQFLTDILPKKILARDYLKSLEEMEKDDENL